MLIDDCEVDNFINQKILERNYFSEKILVSLNGQSALETVNKILADPDGLAQLPDVFFIDLEMPLMDGFQFAQELLRLNSDIGVTKKLVILTASINPEDSVRILRLSDRITFLQKPLSDIALDLIA